MIDQIREDTGAEATVDRSSRRRFLTGAVAASVAGAGLGLFKKGPAFAQTATAADTPTQIFSIARTAERLAVTFYSNAVANATALGITGGNLDYLKAALIEEQIHEKFFATNGGTPLTSTFSFPMGAKTFTDLATFVATQQQLEGAFDSAFIAAAEQFAQMGNPTVARIAVQIAMIESEHRVLGRRIGGLTPNPNWAYAPKLVAKVSDAPGVLAGAGYLSPTTGNTYTYQEVDFTRADLAAMYTAVQYKEGPFAATS